MEGEPRNPDDGEQSPSPAAAAPDTNEVRRAPEATIEFGSLEFVPPEGGSWGEWVITRGIAEAEREERPVDHRTAYYMATFLSKISTPALRSLAATGAIDSPGMQQEMVSLMFGQTQQVEIWIGWLANYCRTRAHRGPVDNWRPAIYGQDRVEAEWLRRERVFASLNDLFRAVPLIQRVGNAGQPGWHGLVRHEDRAGGWIVSEGEPGIRRVWETDSDAELEQRYMAIVEAQLQWILDRFGGTARPDGQTEATRGTEG